MRNILFGAAFGLASFAPVVAATTAHATEYPYCASGVRGAGGCTFASREQCSAYVSGTGGYCSSNPRYTSSAFARGSQGRR